MNKFIKNEQFWKNEQYQVGPNKHCSAIFFDPWNPSDFVLAPSTIFVISAEFINKKKELQFTTNQLSSVVEWRTVNLRVRGSNPTLGEAFYGIWS